MKHLIIVIFLLESSLAFSQDGYSLRSLNDSSVSLEISLLDSLVDEREEKLLQVSVHNRYSNPVEIVNICCSNTVILVRNKDGKEISTGMRPKFNGSCEIPILIRAGQIAKLIYPYPMRYIFSQETKVDMRIEYDAIVYEIIDDKRHAVNMHLFSNYISFE